MQLRQIVGRFDTCLIYDVEFGDKIALNFKEEKPLIDCLVDGHFIMTDMELEKIRAAYIKAKNCANEKDCGAK